MSKDIIKIIDGWEFDPEKSSVRIIHGDDGRDKIQMRLDLGVMQMEFDGRPDGTRPEGCESWLEYYQGRQQAHDLANPDSAPFRLESRDCARLLREGVQYYHRYVSFWHLGRYELCARDTSRNLRLFSFVKEYARHDQDRMQFDQWRPYVIVMHCRAVGTPLLELGEVTAALGAIEAGIRAIRQFLADYNQLESADRCAELIGLERWRDELTTAHPQKVPALPDGDPLGRLRRELEKAISEERFEDAAGLRDQIHRLSSPPPQSEERL